MGWNQPMKCYQNEILDLGSCLFFNCNVKISFIDSCLTGQRLSMVSKFVILFWCGLKPQRVHLLELCNCHCFHCSSFYLQELSIPVKSLTLLSDMELTALLIGCSASRYSVEIMQKIFLKAIFIIIYNNKRNFFNKAKYCFIKRNKITR